MDSKRKTAKLIDLKHHPRYAAMFGDASKEDIGALADDMKRNGLRNPIEILPDGTIVTGELRVQSAKLLGWSEIEAIVRDDQANGHPIVE